MGVHVCAHMHACVCVHMHVYVCSINNFDDGGYFKTKSQNSDNSKKSMILLSYHLCFKLAFCNGLIFLQEREKGWFQNTDYFVCVWRGGGVSFFCSVFLCCCFVCVCVFKVPLALHKIMWKNIHAPYLLTYCCKHFWGLFYEKEQKKVMLHQIPIEVNWNCDCYNINIL